jgi:branched-chain amino acid aminotransferase
MREAASGCGDEGTVMWAMVNGIFVAAEQARVSLVDRRFLYGDAVFEMLAAYRGHIFRAAAHLQRLSQSLQALDIAYPVTLDQMERDLYAVLERNQTRDAILRLCVSRAHLSADADTPNSKRSFCSIVCDAPRAMPFRIDQRGLRLVPVSLRRVQQTPFPGRAGTINHLNSILALAEAVEHGGDEALLFDTRGFIAEGAYSNVFFVTPAGLVTPTLEAGIAAGVTRAAVVQVVRENGLPLAETLVEPSTLTEASEMFITNTAAGVVPVHTVGQRVFRVPGPITALVARWYWELVAQEAGAAWPEGPRSGPTTALAG